MKPYQKFLSGVALTLFSAFMLCLLTAATPPPVNRNGFSTNVPPAPIDDALSPISNASSIIFATRGARIKNGTNFIFGFNNATGTNQVLSGEGSGIIGFADALSTNTVSGDGSLLLGSASGTRSVNQIASSASIMVGLTSGNDSTNVDGGSGNGGNLFFGSAVNGGLNSIIVASGVTMHGYADAGTNETGGNSSFMSAYADSGGRNSMLVSGGVLFGRATGGGLNQVTGSANKLFGFANGAGTNKVSGTGSMLFGYADATIGSLVGTGTRAFTMGSGGTNDQNDAFIYFSRGFAFTHTTNAMGIGTKTPRSTLEVVGASTFTSFKTNEQLTATTIMGVDGGKREVSVALSGATFDGTTLTITPVTTTNIAGSIVDSVTIPIGAWSGVNAASPATSVSFTNTSDGFSFADAASNSVHMLFSLPLGWTVGTVQASIAAVCTGTNHTTATNVVFGVKAAALGDQDNWANPTYGTEVWVTNHINTASNIAGIGITGPITVGSTPSAAKTILWNLTRIGGQAGDTMTNSSVIATEFRIFYTRTNTTIGPVATSN